MAIGAPLVPRRGQETRSRFPPARVVASRLAGEPWAVAVTVILVGALAGWGVHTWPTEVPWMSFILPVVGAALFLPPRQLVVAYAALLVMMVGIGVELGPRKDATVAAQLVTLALMALMLWFATARAKVGVVGVTGETMLVDMRDRLRAQGELPALPPSWSAEVAIESAFGESFSGDFVVATRSTDERVLEVALVDVSGKGRGAGTRSLLLSGALGGLLGEASACGFLRSANNHLLRLRWREGFATAVHVAVDLETGHYTIGSAGHPPAAKFSAGSGRWQLLGGGRGPVLGVVEDADFPRQEGELRPGDALLLYSDGVIEARGKALAEGTDRMLGRAESFVTKGFDGLAQWLCDHAAAGHGDDRAVVTIWRC